MPWRTDAPIVRLDERLEAVRDGRGDRPRPERPRPLGRRGRVRRDHGTVRLGQVDAAQPARLPRPADDAGPTSSATPTSRSSRTTTISHIRNQRIGFIFQSFNLIPSLTVLENIEVPLFYAGVGLARRAPAGARARGAGRPRRTASTTGRPSSRAASSSASRSRARSRTTRSSSSPTSRPGTSTRRPATRSWTCSASCNDAGKTIIMVTHEDDIAAHAAAHDPHEGRPRRPGAGRRMIAVLARREARALQPHAPAAPVRRSPCSASCSASRRSSRCSRSPRAPPPRRRSRSRPSAARRSASSARSRPRSRAPRAARARMVIYGIKYEDAHRIRESLPERRGHRAGARGRRRRSTTARSGRRPTRSRRCPWYLDEQQPDARDAAAGSPRWTC